jgi:hypothetical protein
LDRVTCRLCQKRPPRRFCPPTGGDICPQCCGQERENTIHCPLDCEYLLAARVHERAHETAPPHTANADVHLTEKFLAEQEPLIVASGRILFLAAMETHDSVDGDVREALDALTRTYRTLESGLVYETKPANTMAAAVQSRFQQEMEQLKQRVSERSGVHSIRDKDILGVLVFWERMEHRANNGRRLGRAFIHSLVSLLPQPSEMPSGAST